MIKNTINHKICKTIRNTSKTFEKPNIVAIKSVITEHPKTLGKLFKTIRLVKKIGSLYISLYSNTEKSKNLRLFKYL